MTTSVSTRTGRILWIDYLRSFITVLVVAHHSSLAYIVYARANTERYMSSTHPIVDRKRWVGLDIFENFNDVFFMTLMFLIGGFFIVKGIERKGEMPFIRDRFYRLFIPFLITISTFTIIGYYPAYLNIHPDGSVKDFLIDFFTVEKWPAGPPWFIWILFVFNLLFAIFSATLIPFVRRSARYLQTLANKPARQFLLFLVICWILYVPASWIFGEYTWTGFGPFVFQKSRLLLYAGSFVIGTMLGVFDQQEGPFAKDSPFMKKTRVWIIRCVLTYLLLITLEGFPKITAALGIWPAKFIYSTIYARSICFSCVAFLTVFRKMITRENKIWNSLCENAYCIYLIHYGLVLFCQYELLRVNLPAFVKFSVTFLFALMASWVLSLLLRRIPIIRAYV